MSVLPFIKKSKRESAHYEILLEGQILLLTKGGGEIFA